MLEYPVNRLEHPLPLDGTYTRAGAMFVPLGQLSSEDRESYIETVPEISDEFLRAGPETLVEFGKYLENFDRVNFSASEPGFSVRAGLFQNLSSMGLFGWNLLHAETLWDALCRARDALRYMQSDGKVTFGVRADRFRLDYENGFGPGAEADLDTRLGAGLFVNLIRQAEGHSAANLAVRFPGCRDHHKRLFPEAVAVTDAPRAIIEFDAAMLRQPLKQSNAGLAAVISRTISDLDGDATGTDVVVEQLQTAAIQETYAPLSLKVISRILGIPGRRLQSELQERGSSFAEIRNRVRLEAAKADLRSGRSVAETAHRLGYAHQQTFSNAFRRWQGLAPTVYASRN